MYKQNPHPFMYNYFPSHTRPRSFPVFFTPFSHTFLPSVRSTKMQSLCLATSRPSSSCLALHLNSNRHHVHVHAHASSSSSLPPSLFTPLRVSAPPSLGFGIAPEKKKKKKQQRGAAGVCQASHLPFHPSTLHWVSAVSTAILMLTKGTTINKAYLVPLFALQAPSSVISWIKGEYGAWSAFLALLVRLFFFIPGDLELPLMGLLLVIVAPHQAISFRRTQPGSIISLAIAGYLAFQHFSHEGSLKKAFSQDGLVSTLAIIVVTVVPLLLFI